MEVAELEGSDTLYKEVIDLGNGVTKNIASGLRGFVPIETMKDAMVIVFVNLKPRTYK